MIVVVDTNVLISGLLWSGPPNQILKWARDGKLTILGCEDTATELAKVLQYKRFKKRLEDLKTTRNEMVAYYMNLVTFVPNPSEKPAIIQEDPFDNIFLAVALQNVAQMIISGDRHLLDLMEYRGIQVVTPSEAVHVLNTLSSPD